MKRSFIIGVTLLLPLLATACNTMEGMGQDIKKGGQSIEHSADRHGADGK